MTRPRNYPDDALLTKKVKLILFHYTGLYIRKIASTFHSIKYKNESYKPGVSANIITMDDPWIFESIESIKDYVDEIVIIDSSEINFSERLKKYIDALKDIEIIYRHENLNILEARILAHNLSTHEWILHWDGDMVAFTSGANSFSILLDYIDKLNKKKYYVIYFPLLNIGVELDKLCKMKYQVEAWVYSNSNKVKIYRRVLDKKNNAYIEMIKIPIYFKKIYLDNLFAIHLKHLMPTKKLIMKMLYFKWMGTKKDPSGDYKKFYETNKDVRIPFYDEDTEFYNLNSKDALPEILSKYKGKSRKQIFKEKGYDESDV